MTTRRRMVRSFSDAPVPPVVLERILDSAREAPSAGNSQGTSMVVLSGPQQTAPFWAATTTPEWRTTSHRWPGLSRAPVVIVVLTSPALYASRYDEPDKITSGLGTFAGNEAESTWDQASWPVPYWFFDAGTTTMLLMLSATDAGLGVGFLGNFRGEADLLTSLGVPATWRYAGAVLLGEPDGGDSPSKSLQRGRRPLTETVHRGRW